MSRVEVRPFVAADAGDAGDLLAERHRRHRLAHPHLPARFKDPVNAAQAVHDALIDDSSGAVALSEGRVVGYLLGAPKPQAAWGPNMWIEAAGHAALDAETVRDMYALAAQRWVDEGRIAHYVLVPASDAGLVSAWFRLGFGHQHSHALLSLSAHAARSAHGVRRAQRRDIPALARLDQALPNHQTKSPVFSAGMPQSLEEYEAEWEKDFDDPAYTTFVAEHDGEVIGSAIACSLEKSSAHKGLNRADNAGFLGFAAVLPHARGHGAGRALGEAVIGWAAEAGFDCVATDWRATNLLSSRAWPALGFKESFLRLHRLVGY
ncbi:MAG TPA: GNAT family N-acetyltransferase [Candidatus Limnocylindrales bacterium]|nr:GNAT family N-acetyltransferase [Candidatus Limnocylindrales bacterium]